jgi:hypothetical protein
MAQMETHAASPVWDWRAGAAGGGGDAGAGGNARAGGGGRTGGSGGAARDALGERRTREAREARQQGMIGGVVGLAVAAVFAWLLHRPTAAMVVATIAVLFAALALAAPLTLYRRVRAVLDKLGHLVGTAMTWLLMTILFYVLFLPVGLVLRAMGKLAFTRFADPALDSYWTRTEGRPHTLDTYRKQF